MNSEHLSFKTSHQRCLRLLLLAALARSCSACAPSNYSSCFNCSACVAQQLWWCDKSDYISANDYGDHAYCAPPSFGCQYGYNQFLQYYGGTCGKYKDRSNGNNNCTYLFTFRTQYDCNVGVGFCAPHLHNPACIGIIYLSCHVFCFLILLLLLRVRWSQDVYGRRRLMYSPANSVSSSQVFVPTLHHRPLTLSPSSPPSVVPCRASRRIV